MTLDELIARLQELKANPDQLEINIGHLKVVAVCPVANEHCWLHADNITVDISSGVTVVKIEGGIGA